MCIDHGLLLRRLTVALALGVLSVAARSGPLIVEQTAKISLPDPAYVFTGRVAIEGNSIILAGSKPVQDPDGVRSRIQAAFLFERSGDRWVYVRKLVEQRDHEHFLVPISVAMDDGLAAVVLGGFGPERLLDYLYVFERTAGGWVSVPARETPEGTDLAVDAGTILASDGTCGWDAMAFRKNAAGDWVAAGTVSGVSRGCDDEFRGGDIDLSGNTFIVAQPESDEPGFFGAAYLFEGAPGSWSRTVLTSPEGPESHAGGRVAIESGRAVISGTATSGSYVFRRDGFGTWVHESTIRPADILMTDFRATIEMDDGFLLQGFPGDDYRATDAGAIGVFQRDASGTYRYVAKLVATEGRFGNPDRVHLSGRTVVAGGGGAAYVFELPADLSQPALRQDDFQDGNSAGWTPLAGSDFSVKTTPTSRVYRQASLAGNATSLLMDSDWRNQSIQADITPTAFSGIDRWFGLAVRYTDAANYYYVTARRSNVIQLRRIVNGVFQPIASASLPIVLNRTYRLRLEAHGTLIRLYVNGNLMLQARDKTHAHGQAGLIMYQTTADYDNVVASPDPSTTLFADNFETGDAAQWTPAGVSAWSIITDGSKVYAQNSLETGARSITGVSTADQILQVRAKATAFVPSKECWFGLTARYNDDANYYYLTVRNSNAISLRKLVNGAIHVLDTAPLTVTTGTWYTLRLEAIGDSLRAYVNGRLLLEANDSSFPTGTYGAIMYKTAARYDNFTALQS